MGGTIPWGIEEACVTDRLREAMIKKVVKATQQSMFRDGVREEVLNVVTSYRV